MQDPDFGSPYDELHDVAGHFRPQWRSYFDRLDQLGVSEAKARWTKAKQLIAQNGATYNDHVDRNPLERPWRISPIPLVLGAQDWRVLARGIAQRARLLSALLADIYGPQRCLTEGALPAELVFDNPLFLRALHGISVAKNNWLPVYGVSLLRAPSGQFRVLEDCTQAPAGMGYALENRMVVTQALPDILSQCNVERLPAFFRLLGQRLQASAPHNRDTPRIAILTPGPYSASYFEQSFLAGYMGIPLVQGEDLVVRDDRVYLKTLSGLQGIDVILRRVHDDYCDPLELEPNSALGVPGFVQAIRAGNVCAANPLGTGLLESPAFQAYLPGLCRHFLREELVLHSVPTYYCGDPSQLRETLADFTHMVLKPTHSTGRTPPTFVNNLSFDEQAELRERVLSSPHHFVAQRFVPASRTPVFVGGELRTRSYVLRCFANCAQPTDYHVMPGGLALIASTDSELAVSMHNGARSKDVWVVSDDPVTDLGVQIQSNRRVELTRGGGDLPSRVADNLYWLGRYTERAEGTGRLARVIGTRLADLDLGASSTNPSVSLTLLLQALHSHVHFLHNDPPSRVPPMPLARAKEEFLGAVSSAAMSGSVVASLKSALRVGRIVRDRISHDTWHILSSLDKTIDQLECVPKGRDVHEVIAHLSQIVITLSGFSGLVMESMTRGFAWRFLDMGRRLERAGILVGLLRNTLHAPCDQEGALLESVLDVADSRMTYRRRYPVQLQPAPVIDLLLADETNPRSVIYQVRTLADHIAQLPPLAPTGVRSRQQKLVLSSLSAIELSDAEGVCEIDPETGTRKELLRLLAQLSSNLPALSDSLTETYLYHANVARHLRRGDPLDVSPNPRIPVV